jgi:hypothetical protein
MTIIIFTRINVHDIFTTTTQQTRTQHAHTPVELKHVIDIVVPMSYSILT